MYLNSKFKELFSNKLLIKEFNLKDLCLGMHIHSLLYYFKRKTIDMDLLLKYAWQGGHYLLIKFAIKRGADN